MKKLNSVKICLCLLPYALFGQNTWTSQQSNTSATLNDVFFIDSNTGWAVGENGTILITFNSGESWSFQSTPITNNLNAVHFINSNDGWIVGDNGTLLFTSNGGDEWTQKQVGLIESIHDIFFINDSIGWFCSDANPSIYKTIDKGNNWITPSQGIPGNMTIHFINENNGWTAMGAAINKTSDGGYHWDIKVLDEANIHSLFFIDENNGFCVGSPICSFKTADGGETWEPMQIQNCLWLNDIFFINNNIGFTVGDGAFQTTDGGSNWIKTCSNSLSAVHFSDTQNGWAVGENGTILYQSSEINSIKEYDNIISNFKIIISQGSSLLNIEYILKEPCYAEIAIYNLKGQKVQGIISELQYPGIKSTNLSLNNIMRGIYLCKLKIGDYIYSRKIIW